jgi:hypothetical protein
VIAVRKTKEIDMPTNDVFQLNVVGQVGRQTVESILHWQNTAASGPSPLADADTLVTAWNTTMQPLYLAMVGTDYLLMGYRARRVNNGGGPTFLAYNGSSPGTGPGVTSVTGAGALLTFPYIETGSPKRQNNTGKLFVPGSIVGAIIDNVIQATYRAALQAFLTALITGLSGSTLSFSYGTYVRSRTAFYPATEGDISFTVGTQRRRYKPFL